MSDELALTENRARVVSIIQNNNTIFDNTTSDLIALSAFVSEKGVDNKVKEFAGSALSYINAYGDPNLKKYGQAAYNNINWIQGGGKVLALRLMPDNAGYSHAFINIQAKKETKTVLNKNNEKVSFPDVTLRPTLCYTEIANTSESLLKTELEKETKESTIDGFFNHLLLVFYPEGRGKAYNNLGIRLTLNNQYDSTYDFRIYNLEVLEYGDNGVANLREGPFYVSFNPDALSSSNESLYIEDVVNTYSNLIKCKANDEQFIALANTINSDVNPYIIDPFFCKTRTVEDKNETYRSTVTGKDEDIHISLLKYDVNGNLLYDTEGNTINNLVDSDDLIEQSITIADNSYRNERYNRQTKTIENMVSIYNSLDDNKYADMLDELLKETEKDSGLGDGQKTKELSGKLIDDNNSLKELNDTLLDLYNTYKSTKDEADYSTLSNKIKASTTLIKSLLDGCVKCLDYNKALQTDSFSLQVESTITNAYQKTSLKEVIDIRSISKKEILNDLSNKILTLKAASDIDDQKESLPEILSDLKKVIDYVKLIIDEYDLDNASTYNTESKIGDIITSYNALVSSFETLSLPYISEVAKADTVASIYRDVTPIINNLYNVCSLVILAVDIDVVKEIAKLINSSISSLGQMCTDNKKYYTDNISTSAGKNDLLDKITINIQNAETLLTTLKNLLYTNQLQNFSNICKFNNGSDGDLDESNPKLRNKTITSLLVKAYNGIIDENVVNTRLLPFNFIIDANYSIEVKNAIASLAKDIRRDFLFIADVTFQNSAEQTITWRKANFPVSSDYIAIYGHDFMIYDEYNSKDIRVTMPYFLSSKIPTTASEYGLQYPMAGNKRGVIDGFKSINFIPNDSYAESLHNNRINYCLNDDKRTKLMSQLTSSATRTPLSDINHVIMVLKMKRDVTLLCEDYLFEIEDDETMSNIEYAVNNYLSQYLDNRTCEEISCKVYASEYDKIRHILRVSISIKFKGVVEVIVVTLDIVQ